MLATVLHGPRDVRYERVEEQPIADALDRLDQREVRPCSILRQQSSRYDLA